MIEKIIKKIKNLINIKEKNPVEESFFKDKITEMVIKEEKQEIPEEVKQQYLTYLSITKSEEVTSVYLTKKQVFKELLKQYYEQEKEKNKEANVEEAV